MTSGDSKQSPTLHSTAAVTLAWAQARGIDTWFSRETTSTNTIAKARVSGAGPSRSGGVATLFLTERQTAGRGRGDHTWTTPPDALLSTWSFPLDFAPQPILSPLVGLALFNAAHSVFGEIAFNLKAPNDLYVGSQKIAGLLIETVMMGEAVTCAVGLGFNAGDAPDALASQATGLARHLSADAIRAHWPRFLDAWFDGLAQTFEAARLSELETETRARLAQALNLHPLLKEKVLNVGPLGQIQTSSRLIDWSEL